MDVKIKVGTRLKELRNQKKITQEQLYHICGIDRTYISDVENGRRNISIETLETILNGLDVSLATFFSKTIFRS
ncbi:MAG: helix-turn-helix transcriptional regulator [Sediminibacterium sp.]|nr:helix-turn-helix transcriptional regulator [Sediminibacterium sp.]